MTDASVDDFLARDAKGDPVVESFEVDLGGKTKTCKAIPATAGLLEDLQKAGDENFNQALSDILERFRTPDFRDENGEVQPDIVEDFRAERLDPLIEGYLTMSGVEQEELDEAVAAQGNPN